MKARAALIAILVLAFIGIADSWYLAESAVTGTDLACGIEGLDGCNIVAASPYSKLMGIPLGVYGVGFYGITFGLALALLFISEQRLIDALRIVTGLGASASVVFLFIQGTLIGAFCIYCILSAFISFLLFFLAMHYFRDPSPKEPAVVPWSAS